MADARVEDMTEDTAPSLDDLVYSVNDPGGTPAPRKVTRRNWLPRRYIQVIPFDFGTDVSSGDGKFYVEIPSDMNGLDLVEISAYHVTAGAATTGSSATSIQITNVSDTADMLSTMIEIGADTAGTSSTADSAGTINTSADDIATGDIIRIDLDIVPSGTAPKGLIVSMGFA